MPRIYSNYSQSDFDTVTTLAKELGFSTSAFQHYCVVFYAGNRGDVSPINTLTRVMLNNLSQRKNGDTFIISSLVPGEWPGLSRSDKMTLAKQLSYYVRARSQEYGIFHIPKGRVTIYKRK